MNNTLVSAVVKGFIAVIIVAAVYMLGASYLKMQGVDQCGKMSQIQKTSATEKIQSPLLDIYNLCLKDKGIK